MPLGVREQGERRVEGGAVHRTNDVMQLGKGHRHGLRDRAQPALVLRVAPSRVMETARRVVKELQPIHPVSRDPMLNGAVRRSRFLCASSSIYYRERAIYGHEESGSRVIAATILIGMIVSGCDVAWGGASIALEKPAPAVDSTAAPVEAVEIEEPLPAADLMYLVRFSGANGSVRVLATAALIGGVPTAIDLPPTIDDSYRVRFDSAFHSANRELGLHANGHRIGSIVLDGTTDVADGVCLSIAGGRALLPPGMAAPEVAFAWAGEGSLGSVALHSVPQPDDRMRTFGPVLAENLLRRGGESRPYLAQRVELEAVPWPGDARPAMAATYLVNDDLTRESPANAASSLFVLARFTPAGGYIPDWSEVRRYGNGASREAFTYLGAITTTAGRIDFVTRHGESGTALAASVDAEGEREIDWVEEGACSSRLLAGPGIAP